MKLDKRGVGLRVADVMTRPPITMHRNATLAEAARTMLERDIGCVLVIDDDGSLAGILTESDFAGRERGIPFSLFRFPKVFDEWLDHPVEEILRAAATRTVAEFMTVRPVTAREDDSLTDVVVRMVRDGRHRIPVVRDGVPVGIVTRHDILRVLANDRGRAVARGRAGARS